MDTKIWGWARFLEGGIFACDIIKFQLLGNGTSVILVIFKQMK